MQLKDYYKILNVPPNADAVQIRKAFRSLALQYHPDKTQGDKHKEALFREVQEAYNVLSDPGSREEYNYKRWYTRSMGKSFVQEPSTPGMILRETTKLADYISSGNNLHIDYDLLSNQIRSILTSHHIAILNQFNEYETNSRIIRLLIKCMSPLPLKYIEPITVLLAQVAGSDNELLREIDKYHKRRVSETYWEKRTAWIVVAISLFICWLMYLYASNN
jgi:molecular chaperone DnaJ